MNIIIPYTPRKAFVQWHSRSQRWSVLVVHRRGGKTVSGINELIKEAMKCQLKAPRFAYLAPYRKQAKEIAWDYLKQYTAPIPGRVVSESELHVKLPNEGRITLYGADNAEALRGIYLDGIIIDEPADMDASVWSSVIRPALSDRRGLGFDRWDPDVTKKYPSQYASPQTYGHTGFTGTCVWVDPASHLVYVFLSNRVNPSVSPKLGSLNTRPRIMDVVYQAIQKGM